MNLSISQPSLRDALTAVSRAVSPRSTSPVLANVLLKAENNRLQISATNLSIGISRWIDALVLEPGAITVPAQTLGELVKALPNDTIRLELDDKTMTMTVRCGKNRTSIKGIDAQDFPLFEEPGDGTSIDTESFIQAISRAAFAVSTEEARPVLQAVYTGGGAMAATDGYRVSVVDIATIEKKVLIPAVGLSEVSKLAKGSQSLAVRLSASGSSIVFQGEGWLLQSQLVDGAFPDVNVILPRQFKVKTIVNTSALLRACQQAEIIAKNGNGVLKLSLCPSVDGPGKIEVSAQSEETGDAEIEIDANIDGPAMSIAFNARYLVEGLNSIGTPDVVLQMNDHQKPAMFSQPGDSSFRHVIMPMQLG